MANGTYTIERLQELRTQADNVGDTDSRDKLAAMITEQGGTVPTTEIPEDESKLGRLERLRQNALAVKDTDSAEKLAVLIAKESDEDPMDPTSAYPKFEEGFDDEPHTPHNGRNLADAPESETPVADLLNGDEKIVIEGGPTIERELPPLNGGMDVHAPPLSVSGEFGGNVDIRTASDFRDTTDKPPAAPESDGEHLEGPIATQPVNNGTASISAVATIKVKKYVLAEILAKDGKKVTIHDVRRYERMLSE